MRQLRAKLKVKVSRLESRWERGKDTPRVMLKVMLKVLHQLEQKLILQTPTCPELNTWTTFTTSTHIL